MTMKYYNKISQLPYLIVNVGHKALTRLLKVSIFYLRSMFHILPLNKQGLLIIYLRKFKETFFVYKQSPRLFIKQPNVEEFFEELNRRKLNYVVLRWFEELPSVPHGEDIDILVSDAHFECVRELCNPYDNGNQKIDLYSASGKYGTNYKGTAYLTSKLANSTLASAYVGDNGVRRPSDEMYFLALCYHIVFHKGMKSGLAFNKDEKDKFSLPEHNYYEILCEYKDTYLNSNKEISMERLFRLLQQHEFIPETDSINLLGRDDAWIRRLLPQNDDRLSIGGELIVFVLRDWLRSTGREADVLEELKNQKLHIIDVITPNKSEIKLITEKVRGGNWGKGPYARSGGKPYKLVVAFDYNPNFVGSLKINSNLNAKIRIRDKINQKLFFWQQVNCIHSSDTEIEALEYLSLLNPKIQSNIKQKVSAVRSSDYFHNYEVIRSLTPNGRRSKTELIRYNGQIAILKSYRPECRSYLESELVAYEFISKKCNHIPRLLSKTNNGIIIEYVHNILDNCTNKKRIEKIRSHADEIVDFMKLFYDNNYCIIGFYPGNILITDKDEIKFIDFEFVNEYKLKPQYFRYSYDIVGVPNDYQGAIPVGDKNHSIRNTWSKYLTKSAKKKIFDAG